MKTNSTQGELSSVVYDWLTLAGHKISKSYCKEEVTSHPDYPAMTSAVDFLDAGNMKYEAVEADASYINEFNYPLIAHIKQAGNQYMHIIKDAQAWDQENEITKDWSGIVIFPEKDTIWKNDENDTSIKKAVQQQLLFAAWCAIGILLFGISVYLQPALLFNLFGFFSLAGIFISIAAFSTELGIQSEVIKQVCGSVSKSGCESVLKSKLAKGIFGITPADAAVIYFTAQFITYLISIFYAPAFSIFPYLAIAGIAISGISLYTQAVVLRQWCALCIGIIFVLLVQAGLAAFSLSTASLNSILIFGGIAAMCTAILIPIKGLIKNITTAKPKINELNKWKSDAGLFLAQLEKEQAVDTTIWENDLILGDLKAPVLITVACNPYCGPCAAAHKQLDYLLEKFEGKVAVQMRLLCNPANEKDSRTIAVKAILQKAVEIKNNSELKQMLSDWFHSMNLEKWKVQWQTTGNHDISKSLKAHSFWVENSQIAFTPTLFVNGRKLSGRYDLKNIEKLIPQLGKDAMVS